MYTENLQKTGKRISIYLCTLANKWNCLMFYANDYRG
jgi:hypothetical protein